MPTPTPEQLVKEILRIDYALCDSRLVPMDLEQRIAAALREYAAAESAALRERLAAAEQERDQLKALIDGCHFDNGDLKITGECLMREIGRLKALNESLAERVAAQSELLTRKADKVADQPAPRLGGVAVWPLVIADMQERDRVGRERYGTPLQTFNGRDALVDCYQECLDMAVYLRQEIEERSAERGGGEEIVRLREALSACWEVSGDPVLVAELIEKALGMSRERGGAGG